MAFDVSSLPSVIVVDDDASVRDALTDYLNRHQFEARAADGGAALDRALSERAADLVVLDLMMPGENGLSICRRLAARGQPVLMLSAMGDTTDRIVGLELGAADYLAKPFEPRELLARIRAVLRRSIAIAEAEAREVLTFDGWRLDIDQRELRDPAGHAVELTVGEFNLLRTFTRHPRRLLTRHQLLDLSRGANAEPFDRAIDLAVSRLRRKLGPAADLIQTVRGEGYRLAVAVRRA
jgi:two-component system, OmpR family, response regulator